MGRISTQTKDKTLAREDLTVGVDNESGSNIRFSLDTLTQFADANISSRKQTGSFLLSSDTDLLEGGLRRDIESRSIQGSPIDPLFAISATTTSSITLGPSLRSSFTSDDNFIKIIDSENEEFFLSMVESYDSTSGVITLSDAMTSEQLSALSSSDNVLRIVRYGDLVVQGGLSITGTANIPVRGETVGIILNGVEQSSVLSEINITDADADAEVTFSPSGVLEINLQSSGGGTGAAASIASFTATPITSDIFNQQTRNVALNWSIDLGGNQLVSAVITSDSLSGDIIIEADELTGNSTIEDLAGTMVFTLTLITRRNELVDSTTITSTATAAVNKSAPVFPSITNIGGGLVTSANEVIPEGREGEISYTFNAGTANGWTLTDSSSLPASPIDVNATGNPSLAYSATWNSGPLSNNDPVLTQSGGNYSALIEWQRARFIRFGSTSSTRPTEAEVLSAAQNDSSIIRQLNPNGANIVSREVDGQRFFIAYDGNQNDLTAIIYLGGDFLGGFTGPFTIGNYKVYVRDEAGIGTTMFSYTLTI